MAVPPYDAGLVGAEYASLREEILKRTEIRYQLHALSLTAFAALVSIGVQTHNALIVLIFPVLALCLAASWLSNLHDIWRISDYLMDEIEAKVGTQSLGWESWSTRSTAGRAPRRRLLRISNRSVFVLTQLVALAVGLYVGLSEGGKTATTAVWTAAALDAVVVGYTIQLLLRAGRRPA